MNPSQGIDYFGRGHWLTDIQVRMSLRARRRMYEHWLAYAGPRPGTRVLDVGSTPDRERLDSNCMIPWFLDEAKASLSLYSPEDIETLRDAFPRAVILPAAGFGRPIPAADRSFDWVASSAVIEHVGSEADQLAFIAECARVGNGLFLTTPNRAHWLEFHTKLPLLHWLPRAAHRKALSALGKSLWASESHLRLVGRRELARLAARALGSAFTFEIRSVWALGMPSNLVLLARRR